MAAFSPWIHLSTWLSSLTRHNANFLSVWTSYSSVFSTLTWCHMVDWLLKCRNDLGFFSGSAPRSRMQLILLHPRSHSPFVIPLSSPRGPTFVSRKSGDSDPLCHPPLRLCSVRRLAVRGPISILGSVSGHHRGYWQEGLLNFVLHYRLNLRKSQPTPLLEVTENVGDNFLKSCEDRDSGLPACLASLRRALYSRQWL
jgi:hypothetical protein